LSAPLVLYGRAGCHLCDEARAILERTGLPFTEVDIDTDDALLRAYLERIPVITAGGAIIAELVVDEALLRGRLAIGPVGRVARG
jgi:glutaredoxin